jgi:hypothetical protein
MKLIHHKSIRKVEVSGMITWLKFKIESENCSGHFQALSSHDSRSQLINFAYNFRMSLLINFDEFHLTWRWLLNEFTCSKSVILNILECNKRGKCEKTIVVVRCIMKTDVIHIFFSENILNLWISMQQHVAGLIVVKGLFVSVNYELM